MFELNEEEIRLVIQCVNNRAALLHQEADQQLARGAAGRQMFEWNREAGNRLGLLAQKLSKQAFAKAS